MFHRAIRELQGDGYFSPYANKQVTTVGVVTGVLRKGFFLQTPDKPWDGLGSDGVFVYSPDWQPEKGYALQVSGVCVDFLKHETAKPVTQINFDQVQIKSTSGADIEAIEFNQEFLPSDNQALAVLLNSLEGMLISIAPGQTFIAPSNRYGDYVLALDADKKDMTVPRTDLGGALIDESNPLRWFPGFRVSNYNHARRLNVGARLTSRVSGPLNYRVDSYQLAVSEAFSVEQQFVELTKSTLKPSDTAVTVMTLNCFNLDPHIESEARVVNPRQDIDDDWGEGRFHTLAQAVVLQANVPDIIALQEIQDNDGAEMTEQTRATDTYELLVGTIEQLSGVRYAWADVAPVAGADGGQPGGNIRNGFLFNPKRVELDKQAIRVLGKDDECFIDSRKPLVGEFVVKSCGQRIAVINVHLASKRHQESIFAPKEPGVDAKLSIRIAQAGVIATEADRLEEKGVEYYITGDFNDTEHSQTLDRLVGGSRTNLVLSLPVTERFDYNHRGKLQVLMHGIVPRALAESGRAEYEIIHGNELIGVVPGAESNKPSDHAYVIVRLSLC